MAAVSATTVVSTKFSTLAATQVYVQNILKFLPEAEIAATAERVCKAWKKWASSESLWKQLCNEQGIPPLRVYDEKTQQFVENYKEGYANLYPILFGPKQYPMFLHVKAHGQVRPLRKDIHFFLNRVDSNWSKKYRLHYSAAAVEHTNSEGITTVLPVTPNLLGELVQQPRVSNRTRYDFVSEEFSDQLGNVPVSSSDWVLISVDVLQSRVYGGVEKVEKVKKLGQGFRMPKPIEVIELNFFEHVRFRTYPYGVKYFTYRSSEFTYSYVDATVATKFENQEFEARVIVGAFQDSGLNIRDTRLINSCYSGVAAACSVSEEDDKKIQVL